MTEICVDPRTGSILDGTDQLMWIEGERTEGTTGASQERPRPNEVAELGHGEAAKGERGRVVTQGYPLQCTQGIARRQCPRRGRDQRIHRNPVTLVTPTGSIAGVKSHPTTNVRTPCRGKHDDARHARRDDR